MTLRREYVIPGALAEYGSFGDLVRGLSPEEWTMASRCGGWSVADVAGHVVGQLTDVVNFRLEGLGSPEATQHQADERRGRSPLQLADELDTSLKVAGDLLAGFDDAAWDGPSPSGAGTLGFGVESLWFDTFVHSFDIRSPLGDSKLQGDGLRPSLSHIAQVLTGEKWGPAELEFAGFETFPISGGGGRTVTGDAADFVLASTGRGDATAFGLDETVNIYR